MAAWSGAYLPPHIIPALPGYAHVTFCADPDELVELPIIAWMVQPHADKKAVEDVEDRTVKSPHDAPLASTATTIPITTFGSVTHIDDNWLLKLPDGTYTDFGDECGNYKDAEAAMAFLKKAVQD